MKKMVLLVAAAGAAAGALFLGGFYVAEQKWFPHRWVKRAEARVARMIAEPAAVETREISTNFVRLTVKAVRVPGESPMTGGGIAEVGRDVLLMTGDGSFFVVRGEAVQSADIRVPPNGREAYEAAARTPELAGMTHVFDWMRYHDLLYIERDAGRSLFVTYTEYRPDDRCYSTAVARLDVPASGAEPSRWQAGADAWRVIFRTRPCLPLKRVLRAMEAHMAGGRMAWDPAAQRVILASGDYHWDGVYNADGVAPPRLLSQDPHADYGKVLQIDPDTGAAEHISLGHRNMQGLLLRKDGSLWAAEHGPRGGDELNLVKPQRNYGWPLVTYGTRYNGLPWPSAQQYGRHDGFEQPVHAWIPSMGISSLTEIENMDPSWDGDLLVAFLAGQTLHRVRIADGRTVFSEPVPVGERIRDVLQLSGGVIALWTDSRKLLFLSRATTDHAGQFIAARIDDMALAPGRRKALEDALIACMECHAFQPDANATAPNLGGIYGRQIASAPFAGYSAALKDRHGGWTRERLREFLLDPRAFAPGTTMPAVPLAPETVDDLIHVLERTNTVE